MNFQFSIFNFKILTIFLVIFSLVLPGIISAQETQAPIKAPQTLEEAKFFGLDILDKLPDAIRKAWREEAVPQLRKMWEWAKPLIEPWWNKILGFFGQEVEKRKSTLEEQFEKEKQEMKEDLPKAGQSIWERFKQLLE